MRLKPLAAIFKHCAGDADKAMTSSGGAASMSVYEDETSSGEAATMFTMGAGFSPRDPCGYSGAATMSTTGGAASHGGAATRSTTGGALSPRHPGGYGGAENMFTMGVGFSPRHPGMNPALYGAAGYGTPRIFFPHPAHLNDEGAPVNAGTTDAGKGRHYCGRSNAAWKYAGIISNGVCGPANVGGEQCQSCQRFTERRLPLAMSGNDGNATNFTHTPRRRNRVCCEPDHPGTLAPGYGQQANTSMYGQPAYGGYGAQPMPGGLYEEAYSAYDQGAGQRSRTRSCC